MEQKNLVKLNCREYEHHLDRKALQLVRSKAGFDKILKSISEGTIERSSLIQTTGSSFRVNHESLPSLYTLFEKACMILDMQQIPHLYIAPIEGIQAYSLGNNEPMIILSSGAVDSLNDEELLFILGHELGHVKSAHTVYLMLISAFPTLGQIIGSFTLGLGEVVSQGIYWSLLHWGRMSEFTADRAGLLCLQDFDIAIGVLAKLAGLPQSKYKDFNPKIFLKQARDFGSFDINDYNKTIKFISTIGQTHPWTVLRARELSLWKVEYERIVKLHSEGDLSNILIPCFNCQFKLVGDEGYCPNCGSRII